MSGRVPIPPKIRFDVLHRDNYTCQYCGAKGPQAGGTAQLEIDHKVPVAYGGTNDPLNLVTACADCNRGKGATRLDEAEDPGLTLRDHQWEICRVTVAIERRPRHVAITISAQRYGAGASRYVIKPQQFVFRLSLPPSWTRQQTSLEAISLMLKDKDRIRLDGFLAHVDSTLRAGGWQQTAKYEWRRVAQRESWLGRRGKGVKKSNAPRSQPMQQIPPRGGEGYEFVVCPRCTGHVPIAAKFCPSCGLQQSNPPLAPAPQASLAAQPSTTWHPSVRQRKRRFGWKSGVALGVPILVLVCVVIGLLANLADDNSDSAEPTATRSLGGEAVAAASKEPLSTSTPVATQTPKPTATEKAKPTATLAAITIDPRCSVASEEQLVTLNTRLHLPPNTGDLRIDHAWVVESKDSLAMPSGDRTLYVMAGRIVGTETDTPLYGVWASAGGTAFTVPLNQTARDVEDAELLHDGYNNGVLMTMDNVEGADIALSCVEEDSEAGA